MIQVFLLVKATFSMMEHNFIEYFNRFITLKRLDYTEKIVAWKSKDLSAEKHTTPTTTNNSLSPSLQWHRNSNLCLVFKGSR